MMRRPRVSLLLAVAIAGGCQRLSPPRSATIHCGQPGIPETPDTAWFEVVLNSEADRTIKGIDLEVFPGSSQASVRVDSAMAACSSSERGVQVLVDGTWRSRPYMQLGTGARFSRAIVRAERGVRVDTLIDMRGPAYQTLSW